MIEKYSLIKNKTKDIVELDAKMKQYMELVDKIYNTQNIELMFGHDEVLSDYIDYEMRDIILAAIKNVTINMLTNKLDEISNTISKRLV